MQTNAALMRSLAFIAIIACAIWTVTDAEKVSPCCVTVSRAIVKETIIGYRLQYKNLPCVKAVVFLTETKQLCVDPSQSWVLKKIKELNRNSQRNKLSPTSATPRLTSSASWNSTASN